MQLFKSVMALTFVLQAAPALTQTVFEATTSDAAEKTADVSTTQLHEILKDGRTILLDARPPKEFSVSHIPEARNVAPQPDRPAHLYVSDVAEVGRLLNGTKDRPLILYCNGPFCGKSKRLADELLEAGYTNVRRYQLGAPGWRALAGTAMETELRALSYIRADKTAVWIDAREASSFSKATVPGARNIPASDLKPGKDQGVMKAAKDDGRLPMEDHNTRIVVFGGDDGNARAVADAIAREAFHNVTFVAASFEQVQAALQ